MFLYQFSDPKLAGNDKPNTLPPPYKTSIHNTDVKPLVPNGLGITSRLDLGNNGTNIRTDVIGTISLDNLKLRGTGSLIKKIGKPEGWFVEAGINGEYKIPIKNIVSPALELNALLVGSVALGKAGGDIWQQASVGAGFELKANSNFTATVLFIAPIEKKGAPVYGFQNASGISFQIEGTFKISKHSFISVGLGYSTSQNGIPYRGSLMLPCDILAFPPK